MFDFGIVGQCWVFFHIIIGLLFIEAKHDYEIKMLICKKKKHIKLKTNKR
jgi:hypothetical protein